jgi:hypothetical protein
MAKANFSNNRPIEFKNQVSCQKGGHMHPLIASLMNENTVVTDGS